jgi:hypothetical protein
MTKLEQHKPIMCTFFQLSAALEALHQGDKSDVARLHDIWKMGAPTPDSIIRNPREYDERKRQAGNVEKRIVFPSALVQWIQDVSARRGFPYNERQALAIALGKSPEYT